MPTGYCDPEDVRSVLQDRELTGPTQPSFVEDEILGVSDWLRKKSDRHWYDSEATDSLVATGTRSATNVRLDVPSSPHAQDRQIQRAGSQWRYPVTRNGRYARIRLPHGFVDTVDRLAVRQRGGDVEDWVAATDKTDGRGEDYYVLEEDQEGHGRSYLYVNADSIGPRVDYGGLLTLDYQFGLDAQDEPWGDVRRGVALVTAAQIVVDDDVLTAIPDQGQLIGVETEAQRALDRGMDYLDPYLEVATA